MVSVCPSFVFLFSTVVSYRNNVFIPQGAQYGLENRAATQPVNCLIVESVTAVQGIP